MPSAPALSGVSSVKVECLDAHTKTNLRERWCGEAALHGSGGMDLWLLRGLMRIASSLDNGGWECGLTRVPTGRDPAETGAGRVMLRRRTGFPALTSLHLTRCYNATMN
jgi:hypothetical protein